MRLIILLFLLIPVWGVAQVGGNATYKFLDLPNSARVAALGGNIISIKEDASTGKYNDLNFAFHNPSLLDSNMSRQFVINYVNLLAGVNFGYIGYGFQRKKFGNLATGMHYINYGEFIRADENGIRNGTFRAAEYAFNINWSLELDSFWTVGTNVKLILSDFERYVSFGIATDLGITYYNPRYKLSAAFVLKNIGTQIKPYHPGNYEPLPFDLQIGLSKKLNHAPFRVSLLAHHLYQWDLTYEDPHAKDNRFSEFSEPNVSDSEGRKMADNALRHFNFGIELLLTKNFHFDFGYNHQRRKEMSIENKSGMVGFSWGFGFKVKKYHISYGRASYHLAGGSNHFSITTNLNEFRKKAE